MDLSMKKPFQRLSKNVLPSLYDVCLQPDLVNLTFKGWETITVDVKGATQSITVNAFDMSIDKASLSEKDKQDAFTPVITYSAKEETVRFDFDHSLQPGKYQLKVDFTGKLNDQLRGFYRNNYTTPDGHQRHAAVTHFEATGARRAYPCFDDPTLKAQFVFTLMAPKDRVTLSNMPVESEKPSADNTDLKIVRFHTTPIMSTYLTAFVVGEYDFLETTSNGGTTIRVYTPLGKREQGRYSLEVAMKSLDYYEGYFGVPYGLPKLDLIALTEFPIGAMENWGLVTYNERSLLVDEQKSSALSRLNVALTVAHELSHNWFGNLVTMDWWTDLWLKEGFATWIEYLCVDSIFPDLNAWNHFVDREQSRALHLDALASSHPVQVKVGDPCEIDEIFDSISYSKGGCLLRMLQSHVGAEVFCKGMNLYLTRHHHGNTQTEDLWSAMGEVSGEDIKHLMDSWTLQMGFPLIKVTEEIDENSNTRKVVLTQEKFSAFTGSSSASAIKPSWVIPYAITTSNSPKSPVLQGVMNEASVEVTLPDCSPGDWIKVNPGQYMFYHVQYSMESLRRLMPAIEKQTLSVPDRIGLLTDLNALCKANHIQAVDIFEMAQSFHQDPDANVCSKLKAALTDLLPYVEEIMQGKTQGYLRFLRDTFRPIGERVGWETAAGEGHTVKMLREQILLLMGTSGEESVRNEATRRFEAHMKGTHILPADLKAPVYATVLQHGGQQAFDSIMKMYDEEDSMEEKNRIERLLGTSPHEDILQQVLDFSLSKKVRQQDSLFVLFGVTRSLRGRQMVWKFVQENWDELFHRYGTSILIGRLFSLVTHYVCKEETAAEIKAFFAGRDCKAGVRSLQQGLEHIGSNVAFLQAQGDAISKFLLNHK